MFALKLETECLLLRFFLSFCSKILNATILNSVNRLKTKRMCKFYFLYHLLSLKKSHLLCFV